MAASGKTITLARLAAQSPQTLVAVAPQIRFGQLVERKKSASRAGSIGDISDEQGSLDALEKPQAFLEAGAAILLAWRHAITKPEEGIESDDQGGLGGESGRDLRFRALRGIQEKEDVGLGDHRLVCAAQRSIEIVGKTKLVRTRSGQRVSAVKACAQTRSQHDDPLEKGGHSLLLRDWLPSSGLC